MIPVVLFFAIVVFFVFWLVLTLYMYSLGTKVEHPSFPYSGIKWNDNIRKLLVFNLFSLFWNIELSAAIVSIVISTATSLWYYSHQNHSNLHDPISRGFKHALIHFGSLCFGSLIMSILLIINIILEYIHR